MVSMRIPMETAMLAHSLVKEIKEMWADRICQGVPMVPQYGPEKKPSPNWCQNMREGTLALIDSRIPDKRVAEMVGAWVLETAIIECPGCEPIFLGDT